ncbi:MAG: DEAD/DEAH box helicase [Bacteroides sp.]|nr:DEAD/DEAH box helicase [Bacteroides sp.]
MTLFSILNDHHIDADLLRKGLKNIGLELSRFEGVAEEQLPLLIELFKTALTIDPHKSSRFMKLDLRKKLDHILKNRPVVGGQTASMGPSIRREEKGKTPLPVDIKNPDRKRIYHTQKRERKLGKVKFFDHRVNNFGIIISLSDHIESHVSPADIRTPPIHDDDMVLFDQVPNGFSRYKAFEVTHKIPVFIFNKENPERSFACPLVDGFSEREILLTGKYDTGFFTVTAKSSVSGWKILTLSPDTIPEETALSFAQKILGAFLHTATDHIRSIEWLTDFLQPHFDRAQFDPVCTDIIHQLELRPIPEIEKEIALLKSLSILKPVLEEKKSYLNKIGFVLWLQGETDVLPEESTQKGVNKWRFEIVPQLSSPTLQQLLTKLMAEVGPTGRVKELYAFLVNRGWSVPDKEELERIVLFIKPFAVAYPEVTIGVTNFRCAESDYYVELYEQGIIKEVSDALLREYIGKLPLKEQQAQFIEKLPPHKIIPFYLAFPDLSDLGRAYAYGIIEHELTHANLLAFDIESDGEQIEEYAWKDHAGTTSEADFEHHEQGISRLVALINSHKLLIGHHIKEFDLPILAAYGASTPTDLIWDTFEVEMLLHPRRFSYGLRTSHHALADTELTYDLFVNQIARLMASPIHLGDLYGLLPARFESVLRQMSLNPHWALLDYDSLHKQSEAFFRPEPSRQTLPEPIAEKLSARLKEPGGKILIAPEFLWDTLFHQFDLLFYADNHFLNLCLNKEKIDTSLANKKLLRTLLNRFVASCLSTGKRPYFHHLPVAIQLKLTREQIRSVCDDLSADATNLSGTSICIRPTDMEFLRQCMQQTPHREVILVGKELYQLTSKLQLGQELDFALIFDRLKNDPIWMQMSGGNSFAPLSQEFCGKLGITELPWFVRNIWLEKTGGGTFRVWCNLDFEASLNELSPEKVSYIDWAEESAVKIHSYVVRPDFKGTGYIAEQKRVNPESLQRRNYWLYQFKLFEGIAHTDRPKILILQDESEAEKLSAYARRKGYFIPDTRVSLARQLELLHTHTSRNKLLITSFRMLDKIISCNYVGPVDFIWDSFLLQEKMQMLRQMELPGLQPDGEQKEDDFQIPIRSMQKEYDLFSLIKSHKHLIDYYYNMLYDNNQESRLFLCDTRLTDYHGIEQTLQLNGLSVRMWSDETEYDTEKEVISTFFPPIHEDENTDFDTEEAKKILQHIFLMPEEGSIPYEWYDYQHLCLNDILPAQKDLLISLPTGAGKSLLFQGPALFRSGFSSKLSIVITPLRALMQDQVEALWEKGFYSNVEYLSGDKSQAEIRDIYRRIAGGEITLLYITPERFRSRSFENAFLTRLDADRGLEYVIFNEAHCISQWGQEFRPDYLNAGKK